MENSQDYHSRRVRHTPVGLRRRQRKVTNPHIHPLVNQGRSIKRHRSHWRGIVRNTKVSEFCSAAQHAWEATETLGAETSSVSVCFSRILSPSFWGDMTSTVCTAYVRCCMATEWAHNPPREREPGRQRWKGCLLLGGEGACFPISFCPPNPRIRFR